MNLLYISIQVNKLAYYIYSSIRLDELFCIFYNWLSSYSSGIDPFHYNPELKRYLIA